MDNYPVHPCANQNAGECVHDSQGSDAKYSRWIGQDYRNTFFNNESKTDWEKPFNDFQYVNRSEVPRMPWHDVTCAFTGAAVLDAVKHFIQRYNSLKSWWKFWDILQLSIEPTSNFTFAQPSTYNNLNIQVLRSVDAWSAGQPHEASIYNAYLDLIKNAKHYIYIENQFFISSQPGKLMAVKNQIQSALADRIYRAYQENEDFHVMIIMPLKPEFGPEWNSGDSNGLTALSYWNYATIYSGENSLFSKLKERKMPAQAIKSYFSVYGLRTHDSLNGNHLATEIIYVHSKIIIIDDRVTIVGSANINDRSMLGERDSEIAVIVEDVDMIDGKMNDKPCQVGKFSHNLRCHLQKKHLGLLDMQNGVSALNVEDPLLSSSTTGISKQAEENTFIYEQVFRSKVIPNNQVWNYEDLENWKTFQGLVDDDQDLAMEELQKIKGNIVIFPPFFLKDELKPSYLDYIQMHLDGRGVTKNINFDEP